LGLIFSSSADSGCRRRCPSVQSTWTDGNVQAKGEGKTVYFLPGRRASYAIAEYAKAWCPKGGGGECHGLRMRGGELGLGKHKRWLFISWVGGSVGSF